jgi:MT0933-like antitoxin protein
MGLGDKFKNLASQAKESVAEHAEQLHGAVEAVSVAANEKTKGKYATKIMKVGQKAGDMIDRSGGAGAEAGAADAATTGTADQAGAAPAEAAPAEAAPAEAAPPPSGEFPSFDE